MQAERAHLQSFIDRFKAKASKAKQAQSRVKRLAKLAGTEAVRAERAFHINFAEPLKLPHSLIRLNHVDAGYPRASRTARRRSCTTSASAWRRAIASACSARTAPASRRW